MTTEHSLQRVDSVFWSKVVLEWELQSGTYGENFSDHAVASMPVLKDLAIGAPYKDAGVFAAVDDDEVAALMHVNTAFLPGYNGKVLRVRHIVLSPKFEFDEKIEVADYGAVLIKVFVGCVQLSFKEMPADHIKFHMKSPAERMFGQGFTDAMNEHEGFDQVAMKGSWIYLSKT